MAVVVSFYLPKSLWPNSWPQDIHDNWAGFGLGIHAWTLQTYLHLKEAGFPCQLTDHFPEAGIVFFHSNVIRTHAFPLVPTPKRFLICMKAEALPYRYAQIHIVQNPLEASDHQYFMPHWPQPGLIPREASRGDRFERIAFFGHEKSLAPELQTAQWFDGLKQLELHWQAVINTNPWNNYETLNTSWADYSQIDAIVAIRSFEKQSKDNNKYKNKPATKLYNAWLAGVPALLGSESAYQIEGKSGINYLEVTSFTALLETLQQLKDHPQKRHALVNQGQQRALTYHPAQITQRWLTFLETVVLPAYQQWQCQSSLQRSWALLRSHGDSLIPRIQQRLHG